jgi:hypothetical protein
VLQFPAPVDGRTPAGPAQDGAALVAGHAASVLVPAAPMDAAPDVTAKLPFQGNAAETVPLPATAASSPGRRQRALPGLVLIPGIVLGMIVIPIILLALLVVNPIALYLEGRAAGPTVDAQASELPRLKVAAGAASAWYLQTGRSVSGLWATPGLELTLDHELEGTGRTFTVTGARPQSWGETITIVERRGQGRASQQTILPASLEAPAALPPPGTVLDGHIAGQVTAPRLSESAQFTTATEDVNLPVKLVVVSWPQLWLDRFVNACRMFFDEDRWLLVTIGALLGWCVLAGGAAIVFRAGHR